jgi:MscS family membrane protein
MTQIRKRMVWSSMGVWALGQAAWGQAATATGTAQGTGGRPAATSFLDELQFDELLLHNRLRDWMVLLVAIVAAIALGRVVTFILQRIARRLDQRQWHGRARVFTGLAAPANLTIVAFGLSIGMAWLTLGPLLADLTKRILLLLYTVAAFWYAFNLVAVIEVALLRLAARTQTTLDDDLVPVVRKALRIFIVVIGALFILQNVFDRDIAAWLAGLGIAGLAVSLAAQDSLKNLFGSLTILFDRPFSKGQRIKFRDFDGAVEEIGFRSTKVRTGDGSLVTIPNSAIVNDPVDNWAVRSSVRRVLNLTLTYDTPVAKVKEALAIVRGLLASEEFRGPVHDTDTVRNSDPPRVFFDEFNTDSLNLRVFYWHRPADWWAYLAYTERLNLRVMEEFEKAGIEFAFPTQTIHLAGDARRPLVVGNGAGGGSLPEGASRGGPGAAG